MRRAPLVFGWLFVLLAAPQARAQVAVLGRGWLLDSAGSTKHQEPIQTHESGATQKRKRL